MIAISFALIFAFVDPQCRLILPLRCQEYGIVNDIFMRCKDDPLP